VQARVVDGSTKTTSSGIISTANAATNAAKPFEFNLRFAGQYEDSESGYHYNWHRYYDPSTGRYLTPDPIGLAGGLNGYGYAGQDPMGAVDPTGLASEALDQIAALGYWDAAMTKLDADNSLDAAKNSGLPGLHNGQADAYRHCYWSCLMTKRMGAVKAETAGNIHEDWGDKAGQPAIERQMDLHNNSAGRGCAGSKDSSIDCDQSCRNKLIDGSLWWIDSTTNTLVHYAPKVK
jgi:RHS repeat-associated protein